ncbi:hypothetical protein CR513_33160, partial [Mucuna pruriens]
MAGDSLPIEEKKSFGKLKTENYQDLERYGYQNLKFSLLQISLVGKGRTSHWFLDCGCSHHMKGDVFMFLDLKPHEVIVSFRGSGKGKIVGIGKVGKHHLPTIENVLQYCDSGYVISFNKETCIVKHKDDMSCPKMMKDEFGIKKLYKKNLVKGLPEISWKTHLLCDAYQKGKKSIFFLNKNVSTSSPVELLHLDLFEPIRTLILGDNYYRYICISIIISDHGKEFENVEFKTFCEKKMLFSLTSPHQELLRKIV